MKYSGLTKISVLISTLCFPFNVWTILNAENNVAIVLACMGIALSVLVLVLWARRVACASNIRAQCRDR